VADSIVRVTRVSTSVRVTVNRPEVRNAFNAEMIAALRETFVALAADRSVRTIVLAGEGKTFSGGADIAWMRASIELTHDENVRDAEALAAMLRAIDECPHPVIARIHGAALGGGCGLAAVADIAVAADDTIFGFSEVKLGILPAVISPFVIAKIGVSQARALFLTGERFDAARARAIGLVHHVEPAGDLDARVVAIVAEFATSSPTAVARAKALIPQVAALSLADATAPTANAIAAQRVSPEGQEGLRAFLERRAAVWDENAG